MAEVFVGRQPIYTRQMEVVAYELLFRNGQADQAAFVDGDGATAQVILNTFMEIGLEQIVGESLAFINFTRSFILGRHCESFPKERVVVEVLEDIEADRQILDALANLSAQGYTIALDDFVYREDLRQLVDVADVIKVDVLALDRDTLKEHVATLRQFDVKLLAEKVETHEDFEFCEELGFDFFQGYFFCRPKTITGQQNPVNRLATLRLLAKLHNPNVDVEELGEAISQDLSLSYKLLRYVNSALHALSRNLDSIHEATVFVGIQRIRTWASIIMLASTEEKPRELIVIAMIRARMCELLAVAMKQDRTERFFTVGLFSVLDAMFDSPMPAVLESLPLSEEISNALLHQEGLLGDTLRVVLAYERCNWNEVNYSELDHNTIKDAYLQSVAWAARITSELASQGQS